jgi:hypothetical protein
VSGAPGGEHEEETARVGGGRAAYPCAQRQRLGATAAGGRLSQFHHRRRGRSGVRPRLRPSGRHLRLPARLELRRAVRWLGGAEGGGFASQAAGQVFWRNPASALVGVYGAYSRYDDGFEPDAARLGAESELYFSRFTLSGIAGVNFDDNDRFFAQARASLYVDDNTKIFAGYVRDDTGAESAGVNAAAAGFEHLFASTGVSIFGEARVGDHDYRAAWAGIKFYLGGPTGSGKSLIGRDREDVAPVWRFIEQKKQKVASSTSATTTTVTTTSTTTTPTTTTTATSTSGLS